MLIQGVVRKCIFEVSWLVCLQWQLKFLVRLWLKNRIVLFIVMLFLVLLKQSMLILVFQFSFVGEQLRKVQVLEKCVLFMCRCRLSFLQVVLIVFSLFGWYIVLILVVWVRVIMCGFGQWIFWCLRVMLWIDVGVSLLILVCVSSSLELLEKNFGVLYLLVLMWVVFEQIMLWQFWYSVVRVRELVVVLLKVKNIL